MNDAKLVPAYRNPPIDELAIGVQFPPIPNFLDAHAGLYWQKVRTDFPRAESQPRIEGPIESPGPPPLPMQVQIRPIDVRQSRTWLVSQSDERLIQIQNTRFILNWRRRGAPYPHFSSTLDLFQSHFAKFCALLDEENLEKPLVQQVELTYINWITDMPVRRFFVPAAGTTISTPMGQREPEQMGWNARYSIGEDGGQDLIRRLYVECQPAVRAKESKEHGIQFALVVRATRPTGIPPEDVISLAKESRLLAAQAFTDLTTADAHEAWGRYK